MPAQSVPMPLGSCWLAGCHGRPVLRALTPRGLQRSMPLLGSQGTQEVPGPRQPQGLFWKQSLHAGAPEMRRRSSVCKEEAEHPASQPGRPGCPLLCVCVWGLHTLAQLHGLLGPSMSAGRGGRGRGTGHPAAPAGRRASQAEVGEIPGTPGSGKARLGGHPSPPDLCLLLNWCSVHAILKSSRPAQPGRPV